MSGKESPLPEVDSPKFKEIAKSSQSSLNSFDSLKKNFRKMNCQVDFVFREQIKEHKMLDRSNSKQSQGEVDSSCNSVPKLDFDQSIDPPARRKSKVSPPISPISKKSENRNLLPINEIESENEHSHRQDQEIFELR